MIPILYEKTETTFTTNGLGRLSDCVRCVITEQRNGVYECEFDYPIDGVHFDDITIGRIIACTHDDYGDIQPFDIYAKSEPINGLVTFNAHHISYRLNEITVKPFSASSCAAALANIDSYSVSTNPFTFWTDKTTTADYLSDVPRLARNMLGGEENSILDVFGTGEYEFDKFTVKFHASRGTDTDVSIRYGKNLVSFENDYDASDEYTAVVPYWKGSVSEDGTTYDVVETLPEWYISSGNTGDSGREIYAPLDLSSEFQEPPAENDLRAAATSRLNASNGWLPNQTVKVDFVQLWQTDEYKNYAPLQRVRLCDTVGVFVPMYNMSLRAKVIEVQYNVLLDRYDSMTLGDKPTSYAATISKQFDSKVESVAAEFRSVPSAIESAVDNATTLIRGGTGGYVVTNVNADGQPIELCVTDNLDLNQAQNIWRWNLGGLGHSSNGYNGTYDTAMTQDGKINADFITTGTMTANRIQGGTLTLGGYDNQNGVMEIKNSSGTTTAEFKASGITLNQYGSLFSLGITSNSVTPYALLNSGGIEFGTLDSSHVRTQKGKIWLASTGISIKAEGSAYMYGESSGLGYKSGNSYITTITTSANYTHVQGKTTTISGTSSLSISVAGHVGSGTGQKVIIPASLGSGGYVSSSYTFYLRSGILCNN